MPAEASAVDAALVARLTDPALAALLPDGVFIDVSAPGATRFVVVTLVDHFDVSRFGAAGGRRASEESLYLVKAVVLDGSASTARAAEARIDALLEDATFPIVGYTLTACARTQRVRYTEVDDADVSIRWQHRGGRYRLLVSPASV